MNVATPLNKSWQILTAIGISISSSSMIILFLSFWLRSKKGLRPFLGCLRIHKGYLIPHPLHTFHFGVGWVTLLMVWAHTSLHNYSQSGDGRGLNTVLSQFYYASGSIVAITTAIGFILSNLEQDLKILQISSLTSDGVETPNKLFWYQTHLLSPWFTNSILLGPILLLMIQFPLLYKSNQALETALGIKFTQELLVNLYEPYLKRAERFFMAYYVCQSFANIFVALTFSYYLFQHKNSDQYKVYRIPAAVAWVICIQAITITPVNILFAADSKTFLVGSGIVSVETAIIVTFITTFFALGIMLIILYYSLLLLPKSNPEKLEFLVV